MNAPTRTARVGPTFFGDRDFFAEHVYDLDGDGGGAFGEIHPATSMVEVRRLISSEMLVEIETEAVVDD